MQTAMSRSAMVCRADGTTMRNALPARAPPQPVALPRLADTVNRMKSLAAATVIATGLMTAGPALADGVTLTVPKSTAAPVHVKMSVDGMEVRPAADGLEEGSGHFHLMIDEPAVFVEGQSIPFDATHLHYGKGQTEADVELAPGKHKLTLQFANALHQSYGPTFASTVDVEIK